MPEDDFPRQPVFRRVSKLRQLIQVCRNNVSRCFSCFFSSLQIVPDHVKHAENRLACFTRPDSIATLQRGLSKSQRFG